MAAYNFPITAYTKLTEIATTVQFVCHYWNQLRDLETPTSRNHLHHFGLFSSAYQHHVRSQIISS